MLAGRIAPFSFTLDGVRTSHLSSVIVYAGVLSLLLALFAHLRRHGEPAMADYVGASGMLLLTALHAATKDLVEPAVALFLGVVVFAPVAALLCAVADFFTGGWDSRPEHEPHAPAA